MIKVTFDESFEQFQRRTGLKPAEAYRIWSDTLTAVHAEWKTRPWPVFASSNRRKQTFEDYPGQAEGA
jgi:hypothetical protein